VIDERLMEEAFLIDTDSRGCSPSESGKERLFLLTALLLSVCGSNCTNTAHHEQADDGWKAAAAATPQKSV